MRTLEDARFHCSSCGSCCRGFRFGPIEPEVIERLKAEKVEEHWPPAAEGWVEELDTPEGTRWMFRNRADGSCVFLQDDNRCAIHARWGAEAKPGFCREFPFRVLKTGGDTVVSLRGECAGLWHSSLDGETVESQAEAILSLPRVLPIAEHRPELVALLPGRGVEEPIYARLEAVFLKMLRGQEPEVGIAAVRDALEAASGRPLPRVPDVEEPLLHLLGRLEDAMGKAEVEPRWQPWQRRRLSEQRSLLRLARKGKVSRLEADAVAYLDLVQRSSLIARSWATYGSLAAGLGRLLLDSAVVRRAGKGKLGAKEVAALHVPYLKAMDHPAATRLLKDESAALVALFLGVQGLVPKPTVAAGEKGP
ncbi:MAG TPA: YkgJ family cysteine cluster protein [Myxococcota bacterium]|nr:YkgJ family cysteine cluster protein [Myxococcota bacterium]